MTRNETKNLAIKDAATKLFILHGLERVSVDDIAKEAKVSKPTIYSRYETKEKLFVAVLIAECEKQVNKMFSPREDGEELEYFIYAKAKEYLGFITDPWYVNLLRNAIYYAAHFDEIGAAFLMYGPQKGVTKLANSLAIEMGKGNLKNLDPYSASEFIISRAKSTSFFNAILARPVADMQSNIHDEAEKICGEFLALYLPD